MGMFDSIYITIKCPECGCEGEIECQTKQLDCELNRYNVGSIIDCEDDYIETISHCRKCDSFFYPNIKLNEGQITGEYYF